MLCHTSLYKANICLYVYNTSYYRKQRAAERLMDGLIE